MTNIKELYQSRLQDIKDTCNLIEPKRVPIMSYSTTWSVGYAGAKTNDILDHPEKMPEITTKYLEDIYFDAQSCAGLIVPIRAIERLGCHTYFVSSDGHTIQHKEHCVMREDEYPKLIADPMDFLINDLGKRKFPALQKSSEEAYQALIDVVRIVEEFTSAIIKSNILTKEKYGIVSILPNGKVYPPIDVIFDRLRGFKGTLIDTRRQRDNVFKGAEAIYPLYEACAKSVKGDFPFAQCTLHAPTYLGYKNFKELFWPRMKDEIMEIYNRGGKSDCTLQGTWKPYFEIMHDELPKGSILCHLEDDDIYETKKLIGDKFAIIGGVSTNMLRYGTRQECIDEAKKIVDICAPGGGLIFSVEKGLCTLGDVNVDNLIAVNQFVHDYGKY